MLNVKFYKSLSTKGNIGSTFWREFRSKHDAVIFQVEFPSFKYITCSCDNPKTNYNIQFINNPMFWSDEAADNFESEFGDLIWYTTNLPQIALTYISVQFLPSLADECWAPSV